MKSISILAGLFGLASASWSNTTQSSVHSSSKAGVTSTLVTYVTTTVCPVTTIVSGHTSVFTTTSTLTVTSCKDGCHKPFLFVVPATLAEHNATSTQTVYTTTSVCPITTVKQGQTFTYTTTSTFVVTSCKGGCPKPTHSVPAVTTSTQTVYTLTTVCPVTTTTVSAGKTYTKTYTTTSTLLSTAVLVNPTQAPSLSTVTLVPFPVQNITATGPVGTAKVTVTIPVTVYTTTCPYTSVDVHGSTSIFLTTLLVSRPTKPVETYPASVMSKPASSPVSLVMPTKPVDTHPAPVMPTKPVQSAPPASQSTGAVVTQISDGQIQVPASSPVSPVKPVTSAPAVTPVTTKPVGPVVTQISDGQIQVPATTVHSSVASATTSTPAQYTGAASKTNTGFVAAVAAIAAFFFF